MSTEEKNDSSSETSNTIDKDFYINKNDICSIHTNVKSITGLKSTSASPSDTWLIDLDKVYFTDKDKDIKLDNAFIKLYINLNSYKTALNTYKITPKTLRKTAEEAQHIIEALDYELLIYKYVVSKLIDNNICPHFVRMYSSSYECSYDTLLKICKNEKNLKRNLGFMFFQLKNRPSITDSDARGYTEFHTIDFTTLKYSYMMTQVFNDTNKFYNYMDLITKKELSNEVLREFMCILFQIVYACSCLYIAKTNHNDLHDSNIFITKREDVKLNLKYTLNGKDFLFKDVSVCARLYDFDQSYSEAFDKNYLIEKYRYIASLSNYLVNNRDIIKILGYVYSFIQKDWVIELFSVPSYEPFWKKVYSEGFYITFEKEPILLKEYERAYSYDKILNNVYAKYLEFSSGYNDQDLTNFDAEYKCDSSMFEIHRCYVETK